MYRLLQLECCENASIRVINRREPRGRISYLFFKNHLGPTLSILSIPFSSILSPPVSTSTKLARRIYLVICIPLKPSHHGGVRFDIIPHECKGYLSNSIILIIHIIFRPIYAVYPECGINNRDERKVRCMIIQDVQI